MPATTTPACGSSRRRSSPLDFGSEPSGTWLRAGRELDHEARPVGNIGLIADVTAVYLSQSSHDRETKAAALVRLRGRGVCPGEPSEQPGQELWRHARSMIEYPHLDHVATSGRIDPHGLLAVLERILQVVVENACQVLRIDPDHQIRRT